MDRLSPRAASCTLRTLTARRGIEVIIPDSYTPEPYQRMSAGDWVTISGTMGTDRTGERVIDLSSVTYETRPPETLNPLGVTNKSVAAASGLLITTWGKVTAINDTGGTDAYYYVDDGSSLQDGSGNTGLRCSGNAAASNAVPMWVITCACRE